MSVRAQIAELVSHATDEQLEAHARWCVLQNEEIVPSKMFQAIKVFLETGDPALRAEAHRATHYAGLTVDRNAAQAAEAATSDRRPRLRVNCIHGRFGTALSSFRQGGSERFLEAALADLESRTGRKSTLEFITFMFEKMKAFRVYCTANPVRARVLFEGLKEAPTSCKLVGDEIHGQWPDREEPGEMGRLYAFQSAVYNWNAGVISDAWERFSRFPLA